TLVARLRGDGTQIYVCKAAAPGYAWTLEAPDAKLLDGTCNQVGTHFAGPTWQSSVDGSAVVGLKVADAPSPDGAIPWLKLMARTTSGQGMFAQVSTIQLVDTVGGLAPTTGCDAAAEGQKRPVPYSANYY